MRMYVFGKPGVFMLVFAVGFWLQTGVVAQIIDSTRVAPDSAFVLVTSDSVSALQPRPSPGFDWAIDADTTMFGRPARRAELNIPALLGKEPGLFHYEFGTLGWPEAVSIEGGDPNRTMLWLDGLAFDDLITGRPRFDLLPYVSIQSIGVTKSAPGYIAGITAIRNNYSGHRPQTDFRYRSGANGLSSIDAVHVQNRSIDALGAGSHVQLLASYSGSSHTGDYPGSRLETARQLQARIRFQRPGWSIELSELYNKQLVGAQAGVISSDGTYDSIYFRLGATVTDPEAERGTIRNDLSLTYRRLFSLRPTTISFAWSTQNMSFTNNIGPDSVDIRVHRFTAFLRQPIELLAKHALAVEFSAVTDQYGGGLEQNKPADESRYYVYALLSDSFRVSSVNTRAVLGIHSDNGVFFPSAKADMRLGAGRLSVSYSGVRSHWSDARGAGVGFRPLDETPAMTQFRAAVGATLNLGSLDFDISGFYTTVTNLVVQFFDSDTGNFADTIPDPISRAGFYLNLSYRPDRFGGLYANVRPTVVQTINSGESYATSRLENVLPEFWINGRIGTRRLLFSGDMDLDLSIRGLWSSAIGGRVLYSTSGLLMVDYGTGTGLDAAARLDIVAEAGIRSAIIFLSYENFLYGNNTGTGISYVPYYPVPAQRFRFGIFWPIAN